MKPAWFTILFLIFALALAACNLPAQAQSPVDVNANASSTAAAQMVSAQLLTLQALQATTANTQAQPTSSVPSATFPSPTNPPPTTAPATATSNCNASQFITDVTIPDGTILEPSQAFTKTWRLKNTGSCSWTPSYAAVFSSGNSMGGPAAQALPGNVNPGQTMDISISFTAPSSVGDYTAYYKLKDASGVLFSQFYVQIKVRTGGDNDDTAFAVTSVTFTETGGCGNFKATANITVNGAGTVTYRWKWSDHAADTGGHAPLVFTSAGTQSVSYTWSPTASGHYWIDIYIDEPNHQQFGRARFSCP